MPVAKKAAAKTAVAKPDVPFKGGTAVKKVAAPKAPKFVLPKTLGAAADMLYSTRERRLELSKQVDELSRQETLIKEYVINTLPKSNAKGVSGKFAHVKVDTKDVPQVKDWDKVYAYITKNKRFDLLQRRLNDKAVQDLLDDKKKIPGIETFTAVKVGCTKA